MTAAADLPHWAVSQLNRLAGLSDVASWSEPEPDLIRIELSSGPTVFVRRLLEEPR